MINDKHIYEFIIDLPVQYKNDIHQIIQDDIRYLNCSNNLYESGFNFLAKNNTHASIKYLEYSFKNALRTLHYQLSTKNLIPKIVKYSIDLDSWYHYTLSGGYHDYHNHQSSSWCGIYYFSVDECSLPNNGVNTFLFDTMNPTDNPKDHTSLFFELNKIRIVPQNNKLIIFPGHYVHDCKMYSGNDPRIVICFNSRCISDLVLERKNII